MEKNLQGGMVALHKEALPVFDYRKFFLCRFLTICNSVYSNLASSFLKATIDHHIATSSKYFSDLIE